MKSNLEKLKVQKSKLDARIQIAEARAKIKEKKNDLSRKILIGTYHLDNAIKNNSMHEINKLMDQYLIRDYDRSLFGLAPIEAKTMKKEKS
jgi:hypothetical protein